ncbi:hypothetical protein N9R43_01715 [bacterium]|nr:hypothetical protein [bacterium]
MTESIPRRSNTKALLDRLRKIRHATKDRRKFHSDFENKEFFNWTPVSKESIKFDAELVPGSGVLTQLIDWCNDNCGGYYVAHRGDLYFEDPTDAAMFIMVWK